MQTRFFQSPPKAVQRGQPLPHTIGLCVFAIQYAGHQSRLDLNNAFGFDTTPPDDTRSHNISYAYDPFVSTIHRLQTKGCLLMLPF